MIRVAVSYDKGEIFEHFGHTEMFAIYEFSEENLDESTKRLVETTGLHGHQDMADLLKREGVDAVICTHCEVRLEPDELGYCIGDFMAACMPFTMESRKVTTPRINGQPRIGCLSLTRCSSSTFSTSPSGVRQTMACMRGPRMRMPSSSA